MFFSLVLYSIQLSTPACEYMYLRVYVELSGLTKSVSGSSVHVSTQQALAFLFFSANFRHATIIVQIQYFRLY